MEEQKLTSSRGGEQSSSKTDSNIQNLSGRGGKRKGAGRPQGTTGKYKEQTVVFYARVTPKQKKLLEAYLKSIK